MNKFLQYQTLVAVVNEGSLSGAARVLNVTASAVSKQLSALETSLDVQLVVRSNRDAKATEAGMQFYEHCRGILSSVATAESLVREDRSEVVGRLSVTLSKSLVRSSVFQLISEFNRIHPEVTFDIILSDDVLDFQDDGIDFAFRLGNLGDSSRLYADYLETVDLVCCASSEYVERYGLIDSGHDLSQHRLIMPDSKSLSEQLRIFFKKSFIKKNMDRWNRANDIETIYQSIASGLAAGYLLDISVRKELESGAFIAMEDAPGLPSKKLYLMRKRQSHVTARVSAFRDFVLGVYRERRG